MSSPTTATPSPPVPPATSTAARASGMRRGRRLHRMDANRSLAGVPSGTRFNLPAPMQTSLTCDKVFVRDLCDGQAVDSVFVVRDRSRRQKRNGEAFAKLRLGDATGVVEA